MRVQDRRVHPRYEVNQCGVLRVLDSESGRELPVNVKDVSLGGLGISLNQKIPLDSLVRVTVAGLSFSGRVAHCRVEEGAFTAGISMLSGTDDLRKLITASRASTQSA